MHLADIDFDGDEQFQDPESRQVDTYTCGHEVPRAPLEVADTDGLALRPAREAALQAARQKRRRPCVVDAMAWSK